MKKSLIVIVALLAVCGAAPAAENSTRDANAAAHAATADDVKALRAVLAEQQKQIEQLRQALDDQKKLIQSLAGPGPAALPKLGEVAATTPVLPPAPEPRHPAAPPQKLEADGKPVSPLTFHIGSASITPVGFMDFTTVFRSRNGGSEIGTNFAAIPFKNTTNGNLSEWRNSARNSRVGFRVDADVKGAKVLGYMEADFLGNQPGNIEVSSNSATMRMRLYWVDLRKGKWEVLGGQSWSLLTPGRTGISPLPGDLFYSQDIDVNYQVGLTWARVPQFRFVYHPNRHIGWGFSAENAEQYVGGSAGGSPVVLPAALSAAYSSQLNTGGNSFGVPNLHPDLISKLAFDGKPAGHNMHFEIAGVLRDFRVYNPLTGAKFTQTAGGGAANFNFELVKGFRLIANTFISDGGGRWIFGQAPDLVVRADGSISPIHAHSTVDGFEYTHDNTLLYAYYGGVYSGRNVAVDTDGKFIGYGYPGAPSSQNRTIQEGTLGVTQTFWKDAKYGALAFMVQYSYLTRNPWALGNGPGNASNHMLFTNLRYTLPGAPPLRSVLTFSSKDHPATPE